MAHHHHYSLADLEALYPYELDIYLKMVHAHIEEIEENVRLTG
jgi:hypothetical protein